MSKGLWRSAARNEPVGREGHAAAAACRIAGRVRCRLWPKSVDGVTPALPRACRLSQCNGIAGNFGETVLHALSAVAARRCEVACADDEQNSDPRKTAEMPLFLTDGPSLGALCHMIDEMKI